MRHLVIVTDCVDIAANELRAQLLSAAGNEPSFAVEPFVPVLPAFSIVNGNFALRLIADGYPDGTVFMVTLSPEKERPSSIVGRCAERDLTFLGRNTGVFDWITRDFGCRELYTLDHWYDASAADYRAFPGKYVTAPLAAQIAGGAPLAEVGKPADPELIRRPEIAPGTIVHIDNFGLMKFAGEDWDLEPGQRYEVTLNDRRIEAVCGHRMMSFDDGEWVLYRGSSLSLMELGRTRRTGAFDIGAQVGDVLEIAPARARLAG